MAHAIDRPIDIEKTTVSHNDTDQIGASSKDSSNVVDAYTPPENTTWKTWVVIFVSSTDDVVGCFADLE
jgi:hypothetical protein